MSYPLNLDEYTEEQLKKELDRRAKTRAKGKCDYCERKIGSKQACKFPERHNFVAD